MTDLDLHASFTAAETIPVKLFLHPEAVRQLRPIHVQWMPTNRCNLKCSFCSCSDRDKQLEMPIDAALSVIDGFAAKGCRSVTITGGGEPICHRDLPRMIERFIDRHIAIGLVTNGLLLNRLPLGTICSLTWCRISNGDDRRFDEHYRETLKSAIQCDNVDWAFSHVVSPNPNLTEIYEIVRFANDHGFTHVRLVPDIFNAESVSFEPIREVLCGIDERVIYQDRRHPVPSSSCLVGYVKPVVAPDFKMYLCCGVQYALKEPSRDMPEALCMGDARDLDSVYDDPQAFSVPCVKCYYENYNAILRSMTSTIVHSEFI